MNFRKEDERVDGRREDHRKNQQLAITYSAKTHTISESNDLQWRDGVARRQTQVLVNAIEKHHGEELDEWVTHVGCEVEKGRRMGRVVEDVELSQRDFFRELQRAPEDDLQCSHRHHLCDTIQLCVIERKRDYVPSSWCRFRNAAAARSHGPSARPCRQSPY